MRTPPNGGDRDRPWESDQGRRGVMPSLPGWRTGDDQRRRQSARRKAGYLPDHGYRRQVRGYRCVQRQRLCQRPADDVSQLEHRRAGAAADKSELSGHNADARKRTNYVSSPISSRHSTPNSAFSRATWSPGKAELIGWTDCTESLSFGTVCGVLEPYRF